MPRYTCFRGTSAPALILVVVGLLIVLCFSTTHAQQGGTQQPEDRTIDHRFQAELIDSISASLDSIYVFPDVAREMGEFLRKKHRDGEYKELTSLREFTRQLTTDLQEVSKDRHLGVRYASDEMVDMYSSDTLPDEEVQRQLEAAQRDNFGFKEVKLMPGNVGYVDLRGFSNASSAGPTAVAAMNFLAHADAIIFDLRKNGGGSPSMIQLLSSYFFEEPVHLNSFYVRATDSIQQFWSSAWVPGPTMYETDLYVLTSPYTFSAAEEFTYNMKNLKRATIVGDTTGGGAHPVDLGLFPNLNVAMRLVFGRAINPVSGTNWEGTGVAPDIYVPQEQALDVAHADALEKIAKRLDDPDRMHEIEWHLDGIKARTNPVTLSEDELNAYVGTYGPRKLQMPNGQLTYQRDDNPVFVLTPMGNDRFMIDDLDYFRIQFERDESGQVVRLVGQYDNGHSDAHERDK